MTVDHIITVQAGGTLAQSNLQPAHGWCNNKRMNNSMEWVEQNRNVFNVYTVGLKKRKAIRNKYKAKGHHLENLRGENLERYVNENTQRKIEELESMERIQ